MMPVAMTAMFSKLSANDTCHALQHLATMRPSLVIPQVLERMYSTLDSLTEPHKLTAAMICMVAVARPMVQGSRNINKGNIIVLCSYHCVIRILLILSNIYIYILIYIFFFL